jgi:hypothetical protein
MKARAAVLLISLAVPVAASARTRTVAPPGNSAVSQYLEVVPTAGGNRPSNTVHPGGAGGSGGAAGLGGSGGSGALTPATQHALAQQGPDGHGVATLAGSTAATSQPGSSGVIPGHRRRPPSTARSNAVTPTSASGRSGDGGSSPLSTFANAVTGSSTRGGLSPLLPAIFIVIMLGGGLIAALRRRTA